MTKDHFLGLSPSPNGTTWGLPHGPPTNILDLNCSNATMVPFLHDTPLEEILVRMSCPYLHKSPLDRF